MDVTWTFIKKNLARVLQSRVVWGMVGWALLLLRYTSEVLQPRYGG